MSQDLWALGGRIVGTMIAGKRANALAEQERRAARPHPSLFQAIAAPLPPERWHTGSHAQFGYPWGWVEIDFSQVPDPGGGVVFVLQAERYDEAVVGIRALQLDACSQEQLLDAAATLEADRAKAMQLAPYAPMGYVQVGGEPGLLVQLHGRAGPQTAGAVALAEVFTTHRGRLYQIQLQGPEENHLAYLQVLWTVLGTWQWR